MKLILSGGGSAKKAEKLDELFASLIPNGKKLIYIPIALQSQPFSDSLRWFQSIFEKWNFEIEMWTDLSDKKASLLNNVGAIYIGGGNVYYLLDKIRNSGFDALLKDFANKDGLIYGGSAGAVLLGKDVGLVQDINESQVKDTAGLGLLDYSIFPHFDESREPTIINYQRKTKNTVLGIPEDSGIFVNNASLKVVGESGVALFKINSTKKYFLPNSLIC